MTTYYVLALLLTMLGTVEFHRTLGQMVHMGSLDQWLLRPFFFAEMAAGFIVGRFLILCIPCIAALGILWMAAPGLFVSLSVHSLWHALLLLPLGLSIFAVLSVLVGTVAFWTMHTDSTFTLIMLVLEFFGGTFLPLSLLPYPLRVIARFSPLRFAIADPIRAIIDPAAPIIPVLLGQAAWVLILLFLTRACWRRGIRRYDAAGG
jgi:ABC-2 type transport system permease protein